MGTLNARSSSRMRQGVNKRLAMDVLFHTKEAGLLDPRSLSKSNIAMLTFDISVGSISSGSNDSKPLPKRF